jgi:predicted dehydrogenase
MAASKPVGYAVIGLGSGRLGRLKYIHSAFEIVFRARGKAGAWHLDPKLAGGGALPDVGVYCVNTIRWLVGEEPLEASAYQKFKIIDELSLELDAFANSIRRQREPEPNGVQGMRDVAVMEAIDQSAREGRTVPIILPE